MSNPSQMKGDVVNHSTCGDSAHNLPVPIGIELDEAERGIWLGANELINLQTLITHVRWWGDRWQTQLNPALELLGSRQSGQYQEHAVAMVMLAAGLQRKLAGHHQEP